MQGGLLRWHESLTWMPGSSETSSPFWVRGGLLSRNGRRRKKELQRDIRTDQEVGGARPERFPADGPGTYAEGDG